MTTTAIFVWLGWGLAGLGALVACWALFWNRSRGRKRCPKCWYDMAGAAAFPAACSECGRVVRRERGLRRTRRRWVVALVGVLALLGSWFVAHAPAMRQRGWVASMPTLLLVHLAPLPRMNPSWIRYDGAAKALNEELEYRVKSEDLQPIELRALLARHIDNDPNSWTHLFSNRPAWPAGKRLYLAFNRAWYLSAYGSSFDCIRIVGPQGDGFEAKRRPYASGWGQPWYDLWKLHGAGFVSLAEGPGPHWVTIELLRSNADWPGEFRQFRTRPREGRVIWRRDAPVNSHIGVPMSEVLPSLELPDVREWFEQDCITKLTIDRTPQLVPPSDRNLAAIQFGGFATMPRLPGNLAVAIEIDVLRDGVLVARGHEVWHDSTRWARSKLGSTSFSRERTPLTPSSPMLFAPDPEKSVWRIRVRADTESFLEDFRVWRRWEGEASLPLTLGERNTYIEQSEPAVADGSRPLNAVRILRQTEQWDDAPMSQSDSGASERPRP